MTEKPNLLGKVEPVVEPIVNGIMGVQTEDTEQRQARADEAVDWAAIGTYLAGTLAQMGLMVVALWGIQIARMETAVVYRTFRSARPDKRPVFGSLVFQTGSGWPARSRD